MNQLGADLRQISCPMGVVIEIEGEGQMKVEIPSLSLLSGIAFVHRFLTPATCLDDDLYFLRRITIDEFDAKKVKVSVTKAT